MVSLKSRQSHQREQPGHGDVRAGVLDAFTSGGGLLSEGLADGSVVTIPLLGRPRSTWAGSTSAAAGLSADGQFVRLLEEALAVPSLPGGYREGQRRKNRAPRAPVFLANRSQMGVARSARLQSLLGSHAGLATSYSQFGVLTAMPSAKE
ncbi:MAG: hypothetical protein ACLTYN_15570 [Dysosmobacter welbionis]